MPQRIPAAIPNAQTGQLAAYSSSWLTVLGPRGWACSALVAGDGGVNIFVYPPGDPDPEKASSYPPPGHYVELVGEYTAHGPGKSSVCAYFPDSPAARTLVDQGGCTPPSGLRLQPLTRDVVRFTLPDATGIAIYPQTDPQGGAQAGDSVGVHVATCALPASTATLCDAILNDVAVRYQPANTPSGG
jgi:hypothetical protein